jgi:N-acetylmuramoyl-L-alanine amidase
MRRQRFGRSATVLIAVLATMLLHDTVNVAQGEEVSAAQRRAAHAACNRAQFRVVLDVGHTKEVPGAMSARGVSEYEYNLRLAKELQQRLINDGFTRTVVLITAGAAKPGLVKRVARASEMNADLFLSIHHDSVPATFKQKWRHEGNEHQFSDRFKGHSIFISYDHADRNGSLQFARYLGQRLKAHGMRYTPHYTEPFMGGRRRELVDAEAGVYRFDQLHVLRATRMPAVLFEAGMIINRDEELLLAAGERRAVIGSAVSEAVELFCAPRMPAQRQAVQPATPLPRPRPVIPQ